MRRLAVLVSIFFVGGAVSAQTLPSASGVALYRYAEPGELTKEVQLWGAVRSPGIYQLQRDADLLLLLTLAGGPALAAESDREVREVNVRVVRDPSGARSVVLDAPLGALTSEATPLPGLQDGDLVTLTAQTRQRFTWRDALSITTSAASLAVLILRIVE